MRVAVVALLLLAGCGASTPREEAALQGDPPSRSSSLQAIAELPPLLAGFQRVGAATDYEQLPGGAGMGASARYVPANGEQMVATVYIYDRGRHRRPDGGASPEVAEELRSTSAEVSALVRAGRYRSASPATGMDVGAAGGADGMQCLNFRVVQQNGALTGDSVCVAVQRGAFVKVRLTRWVQPEPATAGRFAARLLSAVLEARAGRRQASLNLRGFALHAEGTGRTVPALSALNQLPNRGRG